ncbi:site-specific integrase [Saccharopolyspora shandongensis]|uniref:tyrosine-type recombinase/integrase n=1 Tax=Saccharopolyspora shandongensis TaxID=418495 RepID=UPI0033EDBE9A
MHDAVEPDHAVAQRPGEIRPAPDAQVHGWRRTLVAGRCGGVVFAPRTINKIVTTFGTTLRGAVDERLLAVSPSAGIKLETVTADDEYFMTRAEAARFREVAAEDSELLDLLIDIGTETGLRWGELVGLHLERVDTKRLVIQVQEVWDKHSSEIKPYPKGRRRRGVPFTKRLGGRLDDYVKRNPPKRCRARHRGGGRCTGALLLASKVGTPLNYGNVRRRHWDSVAERAGLAGVTPHDMRHTYASWLIQDGAGIETVSALLGHKSWTTTMRYAHLADARWAQVRDIIGGPEQTPDELSSDAIAKAVRALAEAEPERWAAVAAALDGEQDPISAPILLPSGGTEGSVKIIDLASRSRSAG